MNQKKIIQMLAGANKVVRDSSQAIKNSSAQYLEKNILHDRYVSREEYDQLSQLVVKLQNEVNGLKQQNDNNNS